MDQLTPRDGPIHDCPMHVHDECDWAVTEEEDKPEEASAPSFELPKSIKSLEDPKVWIADTGATAHSTPHECGFKNKNHTTGKMTVGIGQVEGANYFGDIAGTMHDKNGDFVQTGKMTEVGFVQSNKHPLHSLSRMINKKGCSMTGDESKIELARGNTQTTFDIVIPTQKGAIHAMHFVRDQAQDENGNLVVDHPQKTSANRMHEMLAHDGTEGQMRETADHLGCEIARGAIKPSLACTVGKASQKALSTQRKEKPPEDGGKRSFLDVSTLKKRPKDKVVVTNPNWRILCDHETGLKITEFCPKKDEMVEPTLAKFD